MNFTNPEQAAVEVIAELAANDEVFTFEMSGRLYGALRLNDLQALVLEIRDDALGIENYSEIFGGQTHNKVFVINGVKLMRGDSPTLWPESNALYQCLISEVDNYVDTHPIS